MSDKRFNQYKNIMLWVDLGWVGVGREKVILNDPKIDLILDLLQMSGGGVCLFIRVYDCSYLST